MRTLDDIIGDIVACADEADGGKLDVRAYAEELRDRAECARADLIEAVVRDLDSATARLRRLLR